jgi:tetratricopeptide (TPR) repeat protein
MLFDLSDPKRKTAVRIVFGFLAVIFAGGFIFLGIGTEGGFNPFDNAGGGSADEVFEQQIEDAEQEIAENPNDPEPIASLIVLRASSGDRQLEFDEETGVPTALTEESRAEYEEAIALWQEYLDAKPKKVNTAAAGAIVQSYRFLGDSKGAIAAQRAFAESDPSAISLGFLAELLYLDLQIEEGDKARDEAIAAADPENKQLITKQLEATRKQAVKAEKAEEKQPDPATGEGSELSDPFGGLSPADPATEAP